MENQSLSTSRHFTLQELAEGVYAAIATDGGGAICNAGLIDLGGRVVVFDTFLTPSAAQDLKSAAAALTGRVPDLVINSHYHNDHIWGNQVFIPGAVILSSSRTRSLMTTEGQEEYDYYKANTVKNLATYRERLAAAANAAQAAEFSLWVGYYEWLAADLPTLTVYKPQITLDGNGHIHGTKRSVQLLEFENGHTGSDLVLYLPEERIVFASDLLFIHMHPYLGECRPEKLLAALETIRQLGAVTFVPGHGPVGTADDLERMADYTQDCLDTAQRLVTAGESCENLSERMEIPTRFRDWAMNRFYFANIQAFCKLLKESGA